MAGPPAPMSPQSVLHQLLSHAASERLTLGNDQAAKLLETFKPVTTSQLTGRINRGFLLIVLALTDRIEILEAKR